MSLTEAIPGMRPGATVRNLLVAFLLFLFLPLVVVVLPFAVAVMVARNRSGIAGRLSALPGIGPNGGAKAGAAAFGYVIVASMVFITIVGAGSGGDAGAADPVETTSVDTATATQTATATEVPSEKERARRAARDGLDSSGAWSDGVREIGFVEKTDGSLLMNVRYDLDTSFLDGADDAEERAGFTARNVVTTLAESGIEDVEIAIFAYVPTSDGGETVSTKVVISVETVRSINWDTCAWECLPEQADQYKFNRYLYE